MVTGRSGSEKYRAWGSLVKLINLTEPFGKPGEKATWSIGAKDGVGTAYSSSSLLWYTLARGIVTEVYFPTVDRPRTKDIQFLFSSGGAIEAEVNLEHSIEPIGDSLGYRVSGKGAGFTYEKEIFSDPHLPCLLQHMTISAEPDTLSKLKIYSLCAPHLSGSGDEDCAETITFLGTKILVAHNQNVYLAMGANVPFIKTSVGYSGASDGWADLHQHGALEWEFENAGPGNVALTGELDLSTCNEFTLGVAFGATRHHAITTLMQSLTTPISRQREDFVDQWRRMEEGTLPLDGQSSDQGATYRNSVKVLLAHEDKLHPGAMIASLAIPWGDVKVGKEGEGGYHLVWTRDMVQCAMGLLAAGKRETPLRALVFLAVSQREDGSFPQNFWVRGDPFWTGLQLDEIAFPILLAHRLWKESALENFRGKDLVLRAVRFLVKNGPISKQERWEELAGLSPSTLAVLIAALICSADMARSLDHHQTAEFLESYADWIERNLERWTVTRESTLLPDVKSHYVRIYPADLGDTPPPDGVGDAKVKLSSRAPGAQSEFPAKDIVDGGFLELVRYGVRAPTDPIILETVKVVDTLLRKDMESGAAWLRYNNDGYGQQEDGSPYSDHGKGGAWPLLAGERGHYELAAGRTAAEYVKSMECLATATHLIPEQSWAGLAIPEHGMENGRPAGSAAPLAWAHAEYIKLLRSANDGKVYDLIPEVAKRYGQGRPQAPVVEYWLFGCPTGQVPPGVTLRVIAEAEFELRFSLDEWASATQERSKASEIGMYYQDVQIAPSSQATCSFTFFWSDAAKWEGRNFEVRVKA